MFTNTHEIYEVQILTEVMCRVSRVLVTGERGGVGFAEVAASASRDVTPFSDVTALRDVTSLREVVSFGEVTTCFEVGTQSYT